MSLDTNMRGVVRATSVPAFGDSSQGRVGINPRGELLVAQGLSELAELVRQGQSFQTMQATAIAALTAVPTTTAGFSIWNGEPDSGKVYVIDSVGVTEVTVDATQQNSLSLFAHMQPGKTTVTDLNLVKASLNGRAGSQTMSQHSSGTTVATNCWAPLGVTPPANTQLVGSNFRSIDVPVRGLFVVRPGGLFSLHAAKAAGTASQLRFHIRWHEVQLPYV